MRGGYIKSFVSSFALLFCLAIGVSLGQPVTAHASGSVEMYVDGDLTGTYGDLMSAFGQMTDATESYVLRLMDDTIGCEDYIVAKDYTWPAVESISIQGPSGDTFAYVSLQGDNTLQSDLSLKGVYVGAAESEAGEYGFSFKMQNHTLTMSGDVHFSGEVEYTNLQTGEWYTELVGDIVGDEGSRIVIEGKTELYCDVTVDEMLLEGRVLFRGGGSHSRVNRLECSTQSTVEFLNMMMVNQFNDGISLSIGECLLHGQSGLDGWQVFSITANGSVLEIGDISCDLEDFHLGFHLGDLYRAVDDVNINITGTMQNISTIELQNSQPISTYSAYKDEFTLDKVLTAPNFTGEVGPAYYHAFCRDVGEWTYGNFSVVKNGDSYYVDRDSIYLEEPSVDDEYVEYTSGEWIYWRSEEGTATIVGYIGVGKEVVWIPENIDGFSVTELLQLGRTLYDAEGYQFSSLDGVEEIVVPATVTKIGSMAFLESDLWGDMMDLVKLTVAKDNTAFKSIDGVIYTADGASVVAVPQAIEAVKIPEGTESIREYAFYGCFNLKKLYLPDTVEAIETGGLRELDGMVDLRMSQGMESIFGNVGVSCDSLKRLYLPALKPCYMACADSHGYFYGIFSYCSNLDEVVILDENLKLQTEPENLFSDCAPGLKIYCVAGSQTEALLQESGFRTRPLEELAPLRLYDENLVLNIGESHQNYLLRNHYDAAFAESEIVWESSNESVATVDANGLIVALSSGETMISATCNGVTVSTKVTVPMTPEEQLNAFVERMYTIVLGRDGDPAGMADWVDLLLDGKSDGAGIAHGFLQSDEFRNKNLANSDYVQTLYTTFFNRVPADSEVQFWADLLQQGKTREFVLAGFVNSTEFDTLCSNYGISVGVMREDGRGINPGIVRFTERLYTKALERDGDKDGIAAWSVRIADTVASPEEVAISFFHSDEYINKHTTNEEYVKTLYRTFMDREADFDGLCFWLEELYFGQTRDFVLTGFSRSTEFKEIMASYGL